MKRSKKKILKPRTKRTRPNKRKKNKKTKLFKIFIACFFLSIIGIVGLTSYYFIIDKKVAQILLRPRIANSSLIFSDYLKLTNQINIELQSLIKILGARGYVKKETPENPGEYSIINNNLRIYTREFHNNFGFLEKSKIFNYDLETGSINSKDTSIPNITIEPKILSSLTSGQRRESKYLSLEKIPKNLINAVINIEDERFYEHFGIDIIGISRALAINLVNMKYLQGGSTITQQLAKNLLFTPKKTLTRKIQEAFAALSLEKRLTKDKILEMYLNEVYLGQEGSVAIHGMSSASFAFFDKPLSKITLSEASLLAGIIKAPSYYSPIRNYGNAIARRNIVLEKLYENRLIKKDGFEKAKSEKIKIKQKRSFETVASYFAQSLKTELKKDLNLEEQDLSTLNVFTGINYEFQICAENAIKLGLDNLEKTYKNLAKKPLSAGLVAIEPYTGLVKAWVGDRDFSKSQFDNVVQANRQTGSTIKPFVYLTALDRSLNDYKVATTSTLLADRPMEIKTSGKEEFWSPKNYDSEFRGIVTLRYALEKSLNLPTVYLGQKVVEDKIGITLETFGISDNPLAVPSISLGALETNLLRLTNAYATIANGGIYIKPRFYVSVQNRIGEIIATSKIQERRVATSTASYVLTNVLQGVIERGTATIVKRNGFNYQAAGKTGTTNDARDAWFVGYTPNLVAGVWVGYGDNSKIGLTGGSAAAPIWTEFMKCASEFFDDQEFFIPEGIIFQDIDSKTGLKYNNDCLGHPVKEVYIRGTEPPYFCNEDQNDQLNDFVPQEKFNSRRPILKQKNEKEKSIFDLLFG